MPLLPIDNLARRQPDNHNYKPQLHNDIKMHFKLLVAFAALTAATLEPATSNTKGKCPSNLKCSRTFSPNDVKE